MAGGRDERLAKFDKHLQRLPDYAQRAQRAVRAYVDSKDTHDTAKSTGTSTSRRSVLSGSVSAISSLTPVVHDAREKWERWNEPAARHERRKRRTSRALTLWLVLTLLSVLYAVMGYAGVVGGAEGWKGALSGLTFAVPFTVLSVRSGVRLYRLSTMPVPEPTRPPALPPPGSAARKPLDRLARGEASLTDLLDQLTTASHSGAAPVPTLSIEQTRATATEAAVALRDLADRVCSLERAADTTAKADRAALDEAVAALRAQLDEGVDSYGELVAAAGQAVAASSGGVAPARTALTDATDRLAGLASALRELS